MRRTAKQILSASIESAGLKGVMGQRLEDAVLKAMEEYANPVVKPIPSIAPKNIDVKVLPADCRIGIAITTVPSRHEVHMQQMEHIHKFTPENVFVYVHNDINRIGIAKSKNNCIRVLMEMGCQHLILLDDDVYPVKEGWLNMFVNSGIHHLCPTWESLRNGAASGHKIQRTVNGIDYYTSGCGIILYYTRQAIERIGGMDSRYPVWGHEHTGLSMRIRNAGLIPNPYLSPVGWLDYFYSHDYEKSNAPLFDYNERQRLAKIGEPIFKEEQMTSSWKPYEQSDYVLTAFYTTAQDSQRGNKTMAPDLTVLDTMIDSSPCPVVMFTDIQCPENAKFKYIYSKVPKNVDLYNYRFLEQLKWLKANRDYCNIVYILDATDTEFIGEPHPIEKGCVYVNTEGAGGSLLWLIQLSRTSRMRGGLMLSNRGNDLWNCGVIYGYVDDIILLLQSMYQLLLNQKETDMAALNHVCNKGVQGITIVPVKSGFKQDDKSGVYIRHK